MYLMRVLIASHIKPFQKCIDDNDSVGANDKLNLTLSPTYDYLFDQGYITFLDDGTLICGTRLSPFTWSRLNINPASKKKLDTTSRQRNIWTIIGNWYSKIILRSLFNLNERFVYKLF